MPAGRDRGARPRVAPKPFKAGRANSTNVSEAEKPKVRPNNGGGGKRKRKSRETLGDDVLVEASSDDQNEDEEIDGDEDGKEVEEELLQLSRAAGSCLTSAHPVLCPSILCWPRAPRAPRQLHTWRSRSAPYSLAPARANTPARRP